ncbi:polymorphic toxin-type HINT domain-containing protein [Paenibacillus sp. B1-33]|uniref:polymorphic toxin-type HINT domain-containing protein n=1 Tax=unclassified Paenibacillus TaxID=185978 RepID=UPI003D29F9DC
MKKYISLILTFILAFTSIPLTYAQEVMSSDAELSNLSVTDAVYSQQPKDLNPQDIITVSSVAEKFQVDGDWVYGEVTKGYLLHHIYEGLLEKQRGGSYEQYMNRLYPNISRNASEQQPSVTTSVYDHLSNVESDGDVKKTSVTDSVYEVPKFRRSKRSVSSSNYDSFALKQKELKFDQAPYSVGDAGESISTIDGSLHVEQTDLVLPGPNGLDFELRRVYDSSRGKDDIYYSEARHKQLPRKPEEERRSSLGKGWMWDIPYLKVAEDQKFLYLPQRGTFAIDGYDIVGNPFRDLSFGPVYDDKKNDAPKGSRYILGDYNQGLDYYFDEDGLLLRINDQNNNCLDFTHIGDELFRIAASTKAGKEKGKSNYLYIRDMGNHVEAAVKYTDPATNQPKEQVVKYVRKKITLNAEDRYILKEVVDSVGRITTYYYEIRTLPSNILPGYSMFNKKEDFSEQMLYWGVTDCVTLGMIEHPTKAQSQFTSSSEIRKIGFYAIEYQVVYNERKLLYSTNTGATVVSNRQTVTFPEDFGKIFGNVTYNVRVDDGRTITNHNYSVSYREEYERMNEGNYYTFTLDPPILYHNKSETTAKGSNESKSVTYRYNENSDRKMLHSKPIWISETSYGASGSSTRTTSYKYDEFGNVIEETNPLNVTSSYEYKYIPQAQAQKLTKMTTAVGPQSDLIAQYEYETEHGGLQQTTLQDGQGRLLNQVRYERDVHGNPTTIQIKGDNAKDTVIRQEFNEIHNYMFPNKQSVTVKDADGVSGELTTEARYIPETGMLYQFVDGKGQAITYTYDDLNRVTAVTNADGSQTKIEYDDVNNRIVVTDAAGQQTERFFDPFGRLIKETNGRGTAEHRYNEYGDLISKGDSNGSATQYEYDAWGRVIAEQPGYFAATRYQYDDGANTKTVIDGTNNPIKETYDILGRVTLKEELKPSGNVVLARYKYDYAGNVTSSTDANNNVTNYEYDALGRLIAVTDGEGKTTRYQYNLLGDMVEVKYADGNTVQKKYDEIGRLIQQIDPSKQSKKMYYDANGNIARLVDKKGQTQEFEYNQLDLLTSSKASDETIMYQYDAMGRRVSMSDGTGKTQYAYYPTGELESILYPDQTKLSFDYEARQLRTKQTVTTSNFALTSNVDYLYEQPTPTKLKALDGSGTILSEFTYEFNPQSKQLAKFNSLNGYSESYNYDGFNLSGIQQSQNNVQFGQYAYQYDNNRNIVAKNDNGSTFQFSYDPLNRIKTSSQFNEAYTYDQRDNRSTLQSDQVPDIKGANYAYDSRNRLTQVTTEDGKGVSYRYNGDNLMVERTEGGVTTRYYYDDRAKIVAEGKVEANGSVTITAAYIHESKGKLMARQVPGQDMHYYVSNGHGDITEIRDAQGNVLNRYTYDIWGNPLTQEEQVPNNFRYSGEYWDAATNLQYLRARWYDPSIGRFINEDTYEGELGNPLSQNLYAYVKNNPLKYVDPSGHIGIPMAPTPAMTCAASPGQCKTILKGQAEAGKTLLVEGANFLILDDVNTLLNPDGSLNEKALTVASFLPWGKVLKAGKVGSKVSKAVNSLAKCNCFTAGTKVLTDEGEKNIEDIEVGDKVLSKNEETGETAYKEVTHLYRNDKEVIYELTVGDQAIETTDNHPFWVEGKGWVLAVDLQVKDKLQQSNGNTLTIDNIKIVKHDEKVKVYNFTVADFHTYFVSELGIWVHNINSFCGTASDLANMARNSKKSIDGLAGAKVSASLVNDAALDFVGKGAKIQKIDGGMLYISKDGSRSVRTGVKYGKSKKQGTTVYEANFETFNSKGKQLTNYHVDIE